MSDLRTLCSFWRESTSRQRPLYLVVDAATGEALTWSVSRRVVTKWMDGHYPDQRLLLVRCVLHATREPNP